jgi:hypothetical protein
MPARYTAGTGARRAKLRTNPAINGLDVIEVVDTEAPTHALRQRILLLRTMHPSTGAGFTAEQIRFVGGVRVLGEDLTVQALQPLQTAATTPDPDLASAAAWLVDTHNRIDADDTDDPSHWWVLLVDRAGDHAPYELSLVTGPASNAPPAGFDPVLSTVTVRFKLECPTVTLDPGEPLPAPPRVPQIDHLAKDYASFRRLILDRLRAVSPDMVSASAADLGITIVELIAHAADHLSYTQDAVGTEATLGDARLRTSVRRHAKLLDYALHEGCNARTVVQLQPHTPMPDLPAQTPFLSTVGEAVGVHPHTVDDVVKLDTLWFESMHELTRIHPEHVRMQLWTWGEPDVCLPEGATRATLQWVAGMDLQEGDLLLFEEELDPSGEGAAGDPSRRHLVRLSEPPSRGTDALYNQEVLEIVWHDEDALPFPLCLTSVETSAGPAPASVARANLVVVDHGRTGDAPESIHPPDGPHRSAALDRTDLTFSQRFHGPNREATFDDAWARTRPAAGLLTQDPRRAVAHLDLKDKVGNRWRAVPDLLGSAAADRDVVVEMANDRTPWVRFGDGVHGALAPQGTAGLTATYRVGNGRRGNVGAEGLTRIVHQTAGDYLAAVRNPLPATSGADPETIDQAKALAPAAFRVPERAVTEADWTTIADRHPDIQRAVATIRWTGSWYTVTLSVDRVGGAPVDDEFIGELLTFFEPFRLANYDLEIRPPVFVPLDVALSVCVEPTYVRESVHRAILQRLGTGYLPDGRRALFHPDRLSFGDPVYLSHIVEAISEIAGVAWVDARHDVAGHKFQRLLEPPELGLREGVLQMSRLEVPRLDNDPDQPELGRLQLALRGGL